MRKIALECPTSFEAAKLHIIVDVLDYLVELFFSGAATLSIITLSIMALSITTLSIKGLKVTFSIMAFSITTLPLY